MSGVLVPEYALSAEATLGVSSARFDSVAQPAKDREAAAKNNKEESRSE
jgi:hypothetical protein